MFASYRVLMAFVADYWKLKKAYVALKKDNLTSAFDLFISCKRTSKISFNLAVIALWQKKDSYVIYHFLEDALSKDSYLSVAAFYLGILRNDLKYFEASLKGFRNCCDFIDYTAIGMPFMLTREDVLFNLVSLQSPTADLSALQKLSIQSISSLLLSQLADTETLKLRIPPFQDRKMIFNLLPKIEPEPLELKGPEHIVLVEGEEEYFSGFPDAHNRQIKLNLLSENNDYNEIKINEN